MFYNISQNAAQLYSLNWGHLIIQIITWAYIIKKKEVYFVNLKKNKNRLPNE